MKTTRPIKEQWNGTGTPAGPGNPKSEIRAESARQAQPNPKEDAPPKPAIVVERRPKKTTPPEAPASTEPQP
jgi:hypothetical protein